MIQVKREVITPAIAEKMLETNTHNRTLQPRLVNQYARDMLAGNWREHHQGIAFDIDGVLCDGQHRLHAVVVSGVSIPMFVTRGLSKSSADTIDVGKIRTTTDVFTLDGVNRAARIVPIITMLSYITRRVAWHPGNAPTKTEIRQIYEKYRASADWAAFGENGGLPGSLRSASPGCALLLFHLKDPCKADEFRSLLGLPVNQTADSPVLATRTMLERWPRDMSSRRRDLLEHMLSGCYSFATGRKIKVVRPSEEATRYLCDSVGAMV